MSGLKVNWIWDVTGEVETLWVGLRVWVEYLLLGEGILEGEREGASGDEGYGSGRSRRGWGWGQRQWRKQARLSLGTLEAVQHHARWPQSGWRVRMSTRIGWGSSSMVLFDLCCWSSSTRASKTWPVTW